MVNGTIVRVVEGRGFGFIRRGGGDVEYFFHRSTVEGGSFEDLRVGQGVTFEESSSTKGPRANRVVVA